MARVITLFGALFISFASWALSSPPGTSPDENFHIGSIWCADGFQNDNCSLVDSSETGKSLRVNTPHVMDICFIFYQEQSANCSGDLRSKNPELLANNGLYPSFYYSVQNLFVSDRTALSIISMRFVNIFLFCLVLGLLFYVSPKFLKRSLVIGTTIVLIPLGAFLISSINPASWAITGCFANWGFLYNLIAKSYKNRTAAFLNIVGYITTIFLALSSRWDSVFFLIISTIVVLISNFKAFLKLHGDYKIVMLVYSAILIYLFVLFNHFMGAGPENLSGMGGGDQTLGLRHLLYLNSLHFSELYAGILGLTWGLGWLDTFMPQIVPILGLFLLGTWLSRALVQKSKSSYLGTLIGFFFLLAVPIYILTSEGFTVGQQVQPRYLLPIFGIFVLNTFANSTYFYNPNKLDFRNSYFLTMCFLTVSNSISLHTNLRRYVTGLDVTYFDLNHKAEWWWDTSVSPNDIWLLGSLGFIVSATILYSLIKDTYEPNSNSLEAEISPFNEASS